jgi:predicted RNase H-like nuclease (RuvC/YqgF family)
VSKERWIGCVLAVLTLLWVFKEREALVWGPLIAGAALASALYVILSAGKSPMEVPDKNEEKVAWQLKVEEAESRASQTIDGLNKELQKLQQKAIRSEERCLSYQKLVDVHQHEIEKLRGDHQTVVEQLIQKERKLSQLQLARLEPDLFDSELKEEKEKLASEVGSLKQLVTELSQKKSLKKKKATGELEFHDLLG